MVPQKVMNTLKTLVYLKYHLSLFEMYFAVDAIFQVGNFKDAHVRLFYVHGLIRLQE